MKKHQFYRDARKEVDLDLQCLGDIESNLSG
jgi:hypothetical protein